MYYDGEYMYYHGEMPEAVPAVESEMGSVTSALNADEDAGMADLEMVADGCVNIAKAAWCNKKADKCHLSSVETMCIFTCGKCGGSTTAGPLLPTTLQTTTA